jgi:hypothetical protein
MTQLKTTVQRLYGSFPAGWPRAQSPGSRDLEEAVRWPVASFVCVCVCVCVLLVFELRVYALSHSTSPIFVMRFFEIGACELLARAGFEP